jgi:hypothetical protein
MFLILRSDKIKQEIAKPARISQIVGRCDERNRIQKERSVKKHLNLIDIPGQLMG